QIGRARLRAIAREPRIEHEHRQPLLRALRELGERGVVGEAQVVAKPVQAAGHALLTAFLESLLTARRSTVATFARSAIIARWPTTSSITTTLPRTPRRSG